MAVGAIQKEIVNAISDVIDNRPRPIRGVDQIYMKAGDLAQQAVEIGKLLADKSVILVGDGDGVGLAMMHLASLNLVKHAPSKILHLDFDERIVKAVKRFADHYRFSERMDALLYNVVDPLPRDIQRSRDAFYTNPPYGASNAGESVLAFIERGIEATKDATALGVIVIADDPALAWSVHILDRVKAAASDFGFKVDHLQTAVHEYHLDDEPSLRSCNLVISRATARDPKNYKSVPLAEDRHKNFYGNNADLRIQYIRERADLNYGRAFEGTYEIEYRQK